VKLLKCAFLDTNRVFTLLGDGRKIFGVNQGTSGGLKNLRFALS